MTDVFNQSLIYLNELLNQKSMLKFKQLSYKTIMTVGFSEIPLAGDGLDTNFCLNGVLY